MNHWLKRKKKKLRKERNTLMIDSYFPSLSIIFGLSGLIGASVLFFLNDFRHSLFMAGPSMLMFFIKKGTSINFLRKEINQYIKFIGIPFSINAVKYNSVNLLKVNKVRISHRLNSRGNSTTIRYNLYKSFLITEGQAHLLLESKNREHVIEKMQVLAKKLNTTLTVE